jgi:methyl-accepting chemotaxis protein
MFKRLSISAKLYAVFALLALVTATLAAVAVTNSRRQSALMDEFETSFQGLQNVERVTGLIHAVVMESRGVSMSTDIAQAKRYGDLLIKFNERIAKVVADWRKTVQADDARQFKEFSARIAQFMDFRKELVRRGTEINPAAGREWGDNEANRSVRTALNKDLDGLAALYDARAKRTYAELEAITARSFWLLGALGLAAVMLAGFGAVIIGRAITRPLAEITRVTEAVAAGRPTVVTHSERCDEIGALARSIGVFQDAMRRNAELALTVRSDAAARARREDEVAGEIARFGADVEATLAALGRISEQMLASAGQLSGTAREASERTAGAAAASAEASSNVRDIAAATEELSASVTEIDRQVTQSHTIAEQAVAEADRTNAEIKALDDAARRIGDVVKLITAVAEQTNLLALNATIEAARAGEAGRGFAVVASEVKALAGQTAKATEEISAQVAGMQQATLRSVEAIGAIQRTIREVGSITATIAAAVTEQGAATQEIARSAEIASQRTGETAAEVARVGKATADTRDNAAAVKTVADDLGTVAGRIRGEVDGFFQALRTA